MGCALSGLALLSSLALRLALGPGLSGGRPSRTSLLSEALAVGVNVLAEDPEESTEAAPAGRHAVAVLDVVSKDQEENSGNDHEPTQDAEGNLEFHVENRPGWGLSVCDGSQCIIVTGFLSIGIGAAIGIELEIARPRVFEDVRGNLVRPEGSSPYPVASNVGHLAIVFAKGIDDIVKVGSLAGITLELRKSELSSSGTSHGTRHVVVLIDSTVRVGYVVSVGIIRVVISVFVVGIEIDAGRFAEGLEEGIRSSVGEKGVDEVSTGARHYADVIFGDSVEGKGYVRTKALRSCQVPLFVSITAFTVVIVVVYGTFRPTVLGCVEIQPQR